MQLVVGSIDVSLHDAVALAQMLSDRSRQSVVLIFDGIERAVNLGDLARNIVEDIEERIVSNT